MLNAPIWYLKRCKIKLIPTPHCPPVGRLLESVKFEIFILTPPEAIAPQEVYIGNYLQHQYAGVWSVLIVIHH